MGVRAPVNLIGLHDTYGGQVDRMKRNGVIAAWRSCATFRPNALVAASHQPLVHGHGGPEQWRSSPLPVYGVEMHAPGCCSIKTVPRHSYRMYAVLANVVGVHDIYGSSSRWIELNGVANAWKSMQPPIKCMGCRFCIVTCTSAHRTA